MEAKKISEEIAAASPIPAHGRYNDFTLINRDAPEPYQEFSVSAELLDDGSVTLHIQALQTGPGPSLGDHHEASLAVEPGELN